VSERSLVDEEPFYQFIGTGKTPLRIYSERGFCNAQFFYQRSVQGYYRSGRNHLIPQISSLIIASVIKVLG
ncbi:hypothetical protein, partial [Enterococcus sp.]|uniref:hypothetical protein n=1 Tax=Enterococcus sp. TaxID=35783 RepID=UPI00264820F3